MANLKELQYPIHTPETSPFHPTVTLISVSQTSLPGLSPSDHQLASSPLVLSASAAQTCYSHQPHTPLDYLRETPDGRTSADRIARSVFIAGHHSTLEHTSYTFLLEDISRLIVWQVFHSHQHYVSDQQSQRYVRVEEAEATVPLDFHRPSLNRFSQEITQLLLTTYYQLITVLQPTISDAYFERFGKRDEGAIAKLTQEIARYVLPQSTKTALCHTINVPTLFRYYLLQDTFGPEGKAIVQSMVEAVCQFDPSFRQYLQKLTGSKQDNTKIDQYLELAKVNDPKHGLPPWYPQSPAMIDSHQPISHIIANAVRIRLSLKQDQLTDQQALDLLLNPVHNRYLISVFGPGIVDQFTQTLRQANVTAQVVLSLSADSQLQRHRAIAQTAPLQISPPMSVDDFYLPPIITENQQALALYLQAVSSCAQKMQTMLTDGASPQQLQYLFPNSTLIHKQISAPLDGLLHFLGQRSCFRAQYEIWHIATSLASQIGQWDPLLAQHFEHITPCSLRRLAGERPYCPENKNQWCGVANWDNTLSTLPTRRI